MRILVVGIGRLRDRAIESLCEEYCKRASKTLRVERDSVGDRDAVFERAKRLGAKLVLLDETGEQPTSEGLASQLQGWREEGTKAVVFAIGDADGFAQTHRERADLVLSLSKLTLPHRLAHLLLHEQLYRAGTIVSGHPYHRS